MPPENVGGVVFHRLILAVESALLSELLTPRGEPRQNAVVVVPKSVRPRPRAVPSRGLLSPLATWQVIGVGHVGVCRRRTLARRSLPRDNRLWSRSAVEPGREQPPCFCRVAVPSPVRGLLTPRLSPPLSAPRSHARSRSPDALKRRSECRSDRSLIARSIHSLDERAAGAWISAVEIGGEQEGEHRGGTPLRARCSPSRSPGLA